MIGVGLLVLQFARDVSSEGGRPRLQTVLARSPCHRPPPGAAEQDSGDLQIVCRRSYPLGRAARASTECRNARTFAEQTKCSAEGIKVFPNRNILGHGRHDISGSNGTALAPAVSCHRRSSPGPSTALQADADKDHQGSSRDSSHPPISDWPGTKHLRYATGNIKGFGPELGRRFRTRVREQARPDTSPRISGL